MAGTLSIILDRDELGPDHASAVAAAAALPPDGPVLVFDPDAWIALLEATPGREILPASSIVTDGGRIEAVAERLLEFWQGHAGAMGDLVAYRHVRWTRRLAMVAVPLRAALDRVRPGRVRLLSLPGGHALDGPPQDRRTSVLAGVAANLAADRGIAVMLEPRSAGVSCSAGPASDAPASSPPMPSPADPDHVLIISGGPEAGRDLALADAVASLSGRRPVRVVPDAAAGRDVMGESAYAGPRRPATVRDSEAVVGRLQRAAAELPREDPARLFAGPGIGAHLRFLSGEYTAAITGNVERWIAAFRRHRPAVVVASYPGVPLEVAARLGVPAVLLPHGPMMIGEDRYHRCLPEAVAIGAVGPRHHARLLADGIDRLRVRTTGVPGLAPGGPRPRRSTGGGRLHLLLPTGEAARPSQVGTLPVVDFAREHAAIGDLARAACRRGWTLEVRPHPRYDRDAAYYAAAIDGTSGASVVPATERSLTEAVSHADAVVFTGAPSSAMAEAAVAGRPVFRLTAADLVDHADRWGLGRIDHARDADALIGMLEPLATDPSAWSAAAEHAIEQGRELLAGGGDLAAAAFVLEQAGAADPNHSPRPAAAGGIRPIEPMETT